MAGETNLHALLRHMQPRLNEGGYVFCALPAVHQVPAGDCLMLFREAEADTVILAKEKAEQHGLPFQQVYAWITLDVHSSLEAVGLTAAFAQALAAEQISCNVVAGFYHDHIFVTLEAAAKAIQALVNLQQHS